MAIINTSFHSGSFGSSSGTSRPFQQPNNVSNPVDSMYDLVGPLGPTAKKVVNSSAFQLAYSVFSQETDKSWLHRLVAIPNSVQDATPTWVDDLGLSNSYNDKQDSNYQYCMEQISALLAEYQAWKNSLPVTQENQLAKVGYNSAITGEGLQSSSIPNVGVSSNPSQVPSSNPLSAFQALGSFILDGVSGFADVATKFANLRLARQNQSFTHKVTESQFISDINKYMRDNGISSSHPIKSLSDFNEQLVITDSGKDAISFESLFKNALTQNYYAPLLTAMHNDGYTNLDKYRYGFINDAPVFEGNVHGSVSSAVTDVVLKQYEMYKLEREWAIEQNKFSRDILNYQAGTDKFEMFSAEFQKKKDEYESRRDEMLNTMLENLFTQATEGDEDATLLLCKILSNYNYSDIDILKSDADYRDALNATNVVRTGVGAVGQLIP